MARKPAYEDIIYIGDQLLPFIAQWVKDFTRVYIDPEVEMQISYKGKEYSVAPGILYGDLKTHMTFVTQFENSLVARKEQEYLMSQVVPAMKSMGIIGNKGLEIIFKNMLKNMNIPDVDEMDIGGKENIEAIKNARIENVSIIEHGIMDMPEQGEDHAAHLSQHEPFLMQIKSLPEDQRPSIDNIQILESHVAMTKQLAESGAGAGAGAGEMPMDQQGGMEPPPEPRTAGEEMGDFMGAQAGAEQNPMMEM